MSIKKMMLLASALAALVAFAAPAAASAHLEWYESGTPDVTLEGTATAHFVGNLQTSVPSGLVNESCPVTFVGKASNNANGAHAFIEEGNVSTPCPTNLSAFGCEVAQVKFPALEEEGGGGSWTLTTTTPDIVQIHEVTFTNVYTEACAAFGIEHEVSAEGTVTGTLTNEAGPNKEDCVDFNETGGLKTETVPPEEVTIEGRVCLTLPLTLN